MYVSISFFKRYAHHPDLPSSPTRRSSDLSSKGGTLERPHQLDHGVALAPMPILPDLCGCENDTRRNRDSIDQIGNGGDVHGISAVRMTFVKGLHSIYIQSTAI